MITKTELDALVEKYENPDFINSDPVQFIHRVGVGVNVGKNSGGVNTCLSCSEVKDIEIAGFIAALFAFGSRKVFIKKLNTLFDTMEGRPLDFILNGDFNLLSNFDYRFAKPEDVIAILTVLRNLYSSSEGLRELFEYGYKLDNTVLSSLTAVTDYFYANNSDIKPGFSFMLARPRKGGAMKRLNMYLRWMVRKPPVDLALWKFIKPSELLIPLDIHVGNVSRKMGLLSRNANDFKSVLTLTEKLREFDPDDPVKYDFAMFGAGVEGLYKE